MSNEFEKLSQEVVRDFLQSVVAVDDQASYDEEVNETPKTVVRPGRGTARESSHENGPGIHKPRQLNAKSVVDAFAEKGIVCAVLKPKKEEAWDGFLTNTGAAAEKADAVILDWRLLESGDGIKAMELLEAILNRDSKYRSKRSRAVLIYAGEPDPYKISEAIQKRLNLKPESKKEVLRLRGAGCSVTVLVKDHVDLPADLETFQVAENELPEKLIAEFARNRTGLLANVALKSLATLRFYAHDLLSRFPPDIDPAYLTHRLLLKTPQESEDLATQLVSEELSELLAENNVSECASIAPIKSFLRKMFDGQASFELPDQSYNMDEFEDLMESGNAHKKLTSSWINGIDNDECLDEQFAVLTTFRTTYTEKAPVLTLGTVLQEKSSEVKSPEFWICLQPSCDSIRITTKRGFPLLPAEVTSEKAFDLVIRSSDGAHYHCVIRINPYFSRMSYFTPGTELQCVQGVWRKDDKCYTFDSDDCSYAWVGQLKPSFAQKLATDFATKACRVGVDTSEWLGRRSRRRR